MVRLETEGYVAARSVHFNFGATDTPWGVEMGADHFDAIGIMASAPTIDDVDVCVMVAAGEGDRQATALVYLDVSAAAQLRDQLDRSIDAAHQGEAWSPEDQYA